MRLGAFVLTLMLAAPLGAVDYDFDSAVSTLEARLETRRAQIPLLGFGLALAGGVARPLGAKNLQLAIFDRHRIADPTGVDIAQELGPTWRTIVRVTRPGQEQTVIYARDEGNWVKLFLVTLNPDDAVAMQFRLKPTALLRFVAQCQQRGH